MSAQHTESPDLSSPEELFRRRLLWVYSFAGLAQFVGAVTLRLTSDAINETSPIGPVLACLACLVGAMSAYARWHMRLIGRTMMFLGGASVLLGVVIQGGLMSYNIGSLFILPAVCALMLGSRDTAFFAMLVIGGLIGLFVFHDLVPTISLSAEEELTARFRSMLIVSILIITSLVFLVRESEVTDTRLRKVLDEQRFAATHDALTGLPNRAAMNEFMQSLEQSQSPFVFYLIDLDGFKPINDTFGHAAGDLVLKKVADALRRACPEDAFIARLGGDEFFAGLPALSFSQTTESDFGHDLVLALTVPYADGATRKGVTASVGSAGRTGAGDAPSDTLSRADQALYAAKAAGGGNYIVYEVMHAHRAEQSAAASA